MIEKIYSSAISIIILPSDPHCKMKTQRGRGAPSGPLLLQIPVLAPGEPLCPEQRGAKRRGRICLWPSKPLSPGLVPCGPKGINMYFVPLLQSIHKDLEAKIARFHQREDAILYPSCFDANAGLFEVCDAMGGSW